MASLEIGGRWDEMENSLETEDDDRDKGFSGVHKQQLMRGSAGSARTFLFYSCASTARVW